MGQRGIGTEQLSAHPLSAANGRCERGQKRGLEQYTHRKALLGWGCWRQIGPNYDFLDAIVSLPPRDL